MIGVAPSVEVAAGGAPVVISAIAILKMGSLVDTTDGDDFSPTPDPSATPIHPEGVTPTGPPTSTITDKGSAEASSQNATRSATADSASVPPPSSVNDQEGQTPEEGPPECSETSTRTPAGKTYGCNPDWSTKQIKKYNSCVSDFKEKTYEKDNDAKVAIRNCAEEALRAGDAEFGDDPWDNAFGAGDGLWDIAAGATFDFTNALTWGVTEITSQTKGYAYRVGEAIWDVAGKKLATLINWLLNKVSGVLLDILSGIMSLITGTPHPDKLNERPTNAPWGSIYESRLEEAVPMAFTLLMAQWSLVFFFASISPLIGQYRMERMNKRIVLALIGIWFHWYVMSAGLKFSHLLGQWIAPTSAELNSISLAGAIHTSIGQAIIVAIAIVVELNIVLLLFMLVIFMYLLRNFLIYCYMYGMPYLIAFWPVDAFFMKPVSQWSESIMKKFFPLMIFTLPTAFMMKMFVIIMPSGDANAGAGAGVEQAAQTQTGEGTSLVDGLLYGSLAAVIPVAALLIPKFMFGFASQAMQQIRKMKRSRMLKKSMKSGGGGGGGGGGGAAAEAGGEGGATGGEGDMAEGDVDGGVPSLQERTEAFFDDKPIVDGKRAGMLVGAPGNAAKAAGKLKKPAKALGSVATDKSDTLDSIASSRPAQLAGSAAGAATSVENMKKGVYHATKPVDTAKRGMGMAASAASKQAAKGKEKLLTESGLRSNKNMTQSKRQQANAWDGEDPLDDTYNRWMDEEEIKDPDTDRWEVKDKKWRNEEKDYSDPDNEEVKNSKYYSRGSVDRNDTRDQTDHDWDDIEDIFTRDEGASENDDRETFNNDWNVDEEDIDDTYGDLF